ncbi:MAG: tRNA (N(6)-L-threonylcarbamoyladenosine(37)-C(2))-methylthiotransferase [Candidatus Marsarchaeota archaeon]|nr:tRNA (N(6)-L-threonylcarbamoyladenosine(37)-C(2))-methylthiotransferase [Candidatus Marsarchaeota archaeon]MCL5094359.1 tRNA (N(6)-L-threonylcarbamoyladenosine(37)-C(2))-methylthiotransferase [Candidatus Marsarchaeota archaeon]
MKIFIKTYGCTLNQADSELIENILENGKNTVTGNIKDSDIVIVNTCTVKKVTEQKILSFLETLKSQNKKIIVTGCLATANKDLINKYNPDASIVSTANINRITDAVDLVSKNKKALFDNYNKLDKLIYFKPHKKVIARIPIGEGCLNNCSFCETRYARGLLNSFSENLIFKAVKQSLDAGAKEIRLTAQDTGCYGFDKKTNIINLVNKILKIDYDFKLRLGMMNPEYLGKFLEPLIEILQNEKMYKFIHLPLQSGSNKVLKDMRRKYTVEQVYEYINFIRKHIKNITIETDIIVGFPTETNNDFNQTVDAIKKIKPEAINISRFGLRPHIKKLGQLNQKIVKERTNEISRIARDIRYNNNKRFMNKNIRILITEQTNTSINGRTDMYKEVIIKNATKDLIGTYQQIKVELVSANALYGSLVN